MDIPGLPLFSDKGKKEREDYRRSIAEFGGYVAQAATPEDKVVLQGTVDGLKGELRRKQLAHGLETAGMLSAQAGAMAFIPCALTGNSTAILVSGGLILGGLAGIIGGIFTGQQDSRAALIRASGGDTKTIIKYRNPAAYKQLFGGQTPEVPRESPQEFVHRLLEARLMSIDYDQDAVDIGGHQVGLRTD